MIASGKSRNPSGAFRAIATTLRKASAIGRLHRVRPVLLGGCLLLVGCGPAKQQDAIEDGTSKPQPTVHGKTPVNEPGPPPPSTPSPAATAPAETLPTASSEVSASPQANTASNLPVFKSQAANDYLRAYENYIEEFKQAYQELKRGDLSKYRKVIGLTQEMQTKGEVIDGELSPEEQKAMAAYLDQKANELALYASRNP